MTSRIPPQLRKIIHVDMDCFYAAIEIRDQPALADKPVAIGAPASKRGVLCTCNYIARKFGVRSAMPTATAYRHCPDLILLPVNMAKYREVARRIQAIFREYTDLVEPLALDEAYLDVTESIHEQGSATLMAEAIRAKIWQTEQLTASAGVASNKFLAKVASGWNKPNGLCVIRPSEVADFVKNLPVRYLSGVGKVTAPKLAKMNVNTCTDLQKLTLTELSQHFGKLGHDLYNQCRGQDQRPVQANRIRKSLSVETTFAADLHDLKTASDLIQALYEKLILRIQESAPERKIKSQFIKIKFTDFKQKTAETTQSKMSLAHYKALLDSAYAATPKPIRLLGLGVHFQNEQQKSESRQLVLF